MTDEQAIWVLKAVRAYCQPEHLPAVDHALVVLGGRIRARKEYAPGKN